jgi:gas vesicle protein
MSAGRRLARFGGGGLLGAGIGGVAAYFLAPVSGETLRHRLTERLARAKLAGREAEAAKTADLVRRFRERVNDPAALATEESTARLKVTAAADELRAVQAIETEATAFAHKAVPGSV